MRSCVGVAALMFRLAREHTAAELTRLEAWLTEQANA